MSDFFSWFFYRHYLIAGLLFPEVTFTWAVWMRWYGYAGVLAVWVAGRWFNAALTNARSLGLLHG